MRTNLAALILALGITIGLSACAVMKHAFTTPPGTTNPPPAAVTLNQVGTAAREIAPAPIGELIGTVCAGLAAAVSAFAAYHARNASIQTTAENLTAAAKDATTTKG